MPACSIQNPLHQSVVHLLVVLKSSMVIQYIRILCIVGDSAILVVEFV